MKATISRATKQVTLSRKCLQKLFRLYLQGQKGALPEGSLHVHGVIKGLEKLSSDCITDRFDIWYTCIALSTQIVQIFRVKFSIEIIISGNVFSLSLTALDLEYLANDIFLLQPCKDSSDNLPVNKFFFVLLYRHEIKNHHMFVL